MALPWQFWCFSSCLLLPLLCSDVLQQMLKTETVMRIRNILQATCSFSDAYLPSIQIALLSVVVLFLQRIQEQMLTQNGDDLPHCFSSINHCTKVKRKVKISLKGTMKFKDTECFATSQLHKWLNKMFWTFYNSHMVAHWLIDCSTPLVHAHLLKAQLAIDVLFNDTVRSLHDAHRNDIPMPVIWAEIRSLQ